MSVTEYRDRFLQLARYAPADVADDRKKQGRSEPAEESDHDTP